MPWYLYLALKQLFPTGRRFPFFTAISILGVALGVALLVVTTSVMAGFGHDIRRMIVETQGDVQVRGEKPFGEVAAVQSSIARVPGVVASTPFAIGKVMLMYDDKPDFPALQGIEPATINRVIPLDLHLRIGSLDDLDDDAIILSKRLAESLGVRWGDTVQVYSPYILIKAQQDEVMLPRSLRIRGIFEIGHEALDSSIVLVTLRTMQDLYGLGAKVHGINVKVATDEGDEDGEVANAVARRLNAVLPPDLRATAWTEGNREFLYIIQLEKNMIFFLLLFIVVVAAFSVTSSLLISVVRKTREIGVLGALGASPVQVAVCFCFQGFLIGLAGTVAGWGMGWVILHYRNQIIGVFTRFTQSEEILLRFYQFRDLPSYTTGRDIATIVICSVVISTLAGLLPAWRAARLKPVEALRSE